MLLAVVLQVGGVRDLWLRTCAWEPGVMQTQHACRQVCGVYGAHCDGGLWSQAS